MKKTMSILLVVVLLLTASCSDHPTSSQIYSNSFYEFIYRKDWTLTEPYHWYVRLSVPEITPTTIDNGAVFVYYRNSYNTWVLLPYSTPLQNEIGEIFTQEIWSGFADGTLDIDYVYSNSLDPTPPDVLELKIVVMRFQY